MQLHWCTRGECAREGPSGTLGLASTTLANAGTLGETIAFTSLENIVGGTGIDVFTFADGASITGVLDGGLGSNALDYSAYQSPVVINLATQMATGTGGARNVSGVVGGAGSDTLIGLVADAVHAFDILRNNLRRRLGDAPGMQARADRDAMFIWSALHGMASITRSQAMDCLQLAPGVGAAFKDYLMCKVGAALEVPVDPEAPPRRKAGRR